MTFLPIAGRELAVAARRPGTYRLRSYAACIALCIFDMMFWSKAPAGTLGREILSALGVASLVFCILTGLLLTSGSIAAEKQAGTIGLLFLTDLKGYDIVFGKLAAHSISAFFGLLALFPVIGLPLLMGGVTGLEFSRMLLVLAVTMLFSLSLGLAVSALSDDPKQALGWAIMVMGAAAGLLPALWWLQSLSLNVRWLDFLLWPSPAFAFRYSFDWRYRSPGGAADYWHSIETICLLTALCLVWASVVTARVCQTGEPSPRKLRARSRKPRRWSEAETANPFCRVTIRDRAPSALANLLLAVCAPIWLCFLFLSLRTRPAGPPKAFIVCLVMGCALHVIVKLLMIVEGVSRMNHDRHSGALELLLVTPLPVESIIAAQIGAFRAHFRRSLWILGLLNAALMAWVFAFRRALDIDIGDEWLFGVLFIGGVVALLGDSVALFWVGMWQGLSRRQAYKAVILTAAQVLGPCWLPAFYVIFAEPNLGTQYVVAAAFALWFVVGLVSNAISAGLARSRLFGRFRGLVAHGYDKAD